MSGTDGGPESPLERLRGPASSSSTACPMSALVAEAAGPAGGHRRDPRRGNHRSVFRLPRASASCRCCASARRSGTPWWRWTGRATAPPRHTRTPCERPEQRVALAYGAVDKILGAKPRGAGLFLFAHSERLRTGDADGRRRRDRAADLLGVELAGTGLHYADAAKEILKSATATHRPPACVSCSGSPAICIRRRVDRSHGLVDGGPLRGRDGRRTGPGATSRRSPPRSGPGAVQRRRPRAGVGVRLPTRWPRSPPCSPRRRAS